QRVRHVELELGSVESALAGQLLERDADRDEGCLQGSLRTVPELVGAEALFGAERQLDLDVLEPERAVHREQQTIERRDLALDLIRRAEDVRVVLAEAPHPGQAMDDAGALVPMQPPEIGHAPRQLPVASPPLRENQAVARAVHRLLREEVDAAHVSLPRRLE